MTNSESTLIRDLVRRFYDRPWNEWDDTTRSTFFSAAGGLITDVWVLGDLDGLLRQLT